MSTDTRPADRRIIEEASKRGADDYCMDLLLAVIQENGYTIVPSNPAPVVEALREALTAVLKRELPPGVKLHGWRCEHPKLMPECQCVEEFVDMVLEEAALPAQREPVGLTREAVADALNRAWLRSTDAQSVGRPPDLADHLYDVLADSPAAQREPTTPELDVERLGFYDLLTIGEALLTKYPPSRLLCSHDSPDKGPRTTAAIADLIASCRAVEAEREEQGR